MDPCFETVQADADSSFRGIHFSCRSFAEDHTWHYHPEFELTWIMRSAGTRFIGDSIQRFEPGDLVFVGPNLPHCWHNEARGPGKAEEPELVVVQFRPECFGSDFLDLPEARNIKQLFRSSKAGLHILGQTATRVSALMQQLLHEKKARRLICLLEILDELAESSDMRPLASADYHINNDITESNRRRIEFVHRHVRNNLNRKINQAEIAKRVGLTPPAFSRFFRRATGQTFVGFVNLIRINEVCQLLMHDTLSITDIAMSCGYNNIANFNRQFLTFKGMSPSEFRGQRLHLAEHKPSPHVAAAMRSLTATA